MSPSARIIHSPAYYRDFSTSTAASLHLQLYTLLPDFATIELQSTHSWYNATSKHKCFSSSVEDSVADEVPRIYTQSIYNFVNNIATYLITSNSQPQQTGGLMKEFVIYVHSYSAASELFD